MTSSTHDDVRRVAPAASLTRDAPKNEWGRLEIAIALAGGAFPIVVLAIIFLIAVVSVTTETLRGAPPPIEHIVLGCGIVFATAIGSGITGFVYVFVTCAFIQRLIALGLWCMRIRPRRDRLGAWTGAVVAFGSFLPLAIWMLFDADNVAPARILVTALGCLAMFLGQFAGAYAGLINLRDQQQRGDALRNVRNGIRFSIRHVLGLMAAVSVVLALLRLTGPLFPTLATATLVWFIQAVVLHRPLIWLARWRLDRRERRRRASSGRIASATASSTEQFDGERVS